MGSLREEAFKNSNKRCDVCSSGNCNSKERFEPCIEWLGAFTSYLLENGYCKRCYIEETARHNNVVCKSCFVLHPNNDSKYRHKYFCVDCGKEFIIGDDCLEDGEIGVCSNCIDHRSGWIICADCGKLVNGTFYTKELGGCVCINCKPKYKCEGD